MWNYSFLFPSILVLLILLLYCFTRPRLSTRRNRTFIFMLLLELSIIISDIAASVADEHYALFTPAVLYLLNTIYFVLYLTRIYAYFCFIEELLRLFNRKIRAALSIPYIISEIIVLISFSAGTVFSITDGQYQKGPYYDILLYCYLFYIVASLLVLMRKGSVLNKSHIMACLGYNSMLLIGTAARKLLPQLLVMNTFSLAALLFIFLTFENPDLVLTDRGQAFNTRGFYALLSEIIYRDDYFILGFVIRNYTHERSTYGGWQVDQGITQINQYLKKSFPRCKTFYLRGGRFVLTGTDKMDWERIKQQIDERFRNQWRSGNGSLFFRVGFAEIRPQAQLRSVDRIVNNLTIALEMVGNPDETGPKNIVMDADRIQHIDEQVDILRTLERAIERENVEVFLQPVIDSRTGMMSGAEALSRIRDDSGHIIQPFLFIPVAEKNGYIDKLGDIVFEKTCRFIRDNGVKESGLNWVNVNLSPIQCMRPDLTQRLTDILVKYDIPAEMIHLEITEQSMVDYSILEEQIVSLRDANFQLVLDDYGSGYSNIIRVKQYPFINIKIDMEVVWDYFRDRDSLLPNIIKSFREMGFSITAEGIETREMAEAITAIGCDYLQGFVFDKPLPKEVFAAKYLRNRKES